MKFFAQKSLHKPETMFAALVDDMEFHAESSRYRERFIISLLNRICLMVAGYYFKRHREELVTFIQSDELKFLIAKELANEIRMELK